MARKVLIVDDRDHIVHLLQRTFLGQSFETITVIGGVQGWEAIQRLKPDLVILFDAMNELDGFEIVRRMKQNEELHDIDIILLLQTATDKKVFQGWQAGVNCVLSSPVNPIKVLQFVRRIFNSYDELAETK